MSASFNANQRHLHQLNNHDVKALGIHVSRAFLYTKTNMFVMHLPKSELEKVYIPQKGCILFFVKRFTKTIYKMNTLKMMYKGKGERNEQGCRNW